MTKQDVLQAATAAGDAGTCARRGKPASRTGRQPRQARARPRGRARGETRERMTKRRATIARRLVEAQHTAAMLTTFNEVDMTRGDGAARAAQGGLQEDATASASASRRSSSRRRSRALKAFPQLNAEIQGDEIVYKHYYDIGMAVGAEGGLVVPVIRDADRDGVRRHRAGDPRLREEARQDGTLTLEDLTGGTFTITNGGVFGSLHEHADPESAAGRPSSACTRSRTAPVAVNGQVVDPADDVPGALATITASWTGARRCSSW